MADLDLDLDGAHPIRLRRGWEMARPGEPSARLDLPAPWPADGLGPCRLARRFGRPPRLALGASVGLVVESTPGLRSVELNGRPVGFDRSAGRTTVDLGPLEPRNVLTLEVDGDEALAAEVDAWGLVALAIPGEG